MPKFDHRFDDESDDAVLTEQRVRLDKPPLFRVLLHNDDYTTMEFVVYILEDVFNLPTSEAVRVMLEVHTAGRGVAGTYTREIAEMKVAKTISLAQTNEYPLLCTAEEE